MNSNLLSGVLDLPLSKQSGAQQVGASRFICSQIDGEDFLDKESDSNC